MTYDPFQIWFIIWVSIIAISIVGSIAFCDDHDGIVSIITCGVIFGFFWPIIVGAIVTIGPLIALGVVIRNIRKVTF
jgi:hypothetical protein